MNFREANKRLLERGLEFCEEHLPGGEVSGDEYVCSDLNGGRGRSCSVNLKTGRWADFSQDEKGGDLVSLFAATHGLSQYNALHGCLGWLDSDYQPPEPRADTASKDSDPFWWRSEFADKIWEYKDAAGHVVCQVKRWNAQPELKRSKVIRPWSPDTQKYEWPDTDFRPLPADSPEDKAICLF